jgi:hypothetical protein
MQASFALQLVTVKQTMNATYVIKHLSTTIYYNGSFTANK